MPLVALLFGTSAIGSELEDGTAVYLLAKPVSRWSILFTKLAVAAGCSVLLTCVPILLAGLIGAAGALGLSWAVTRHLFDIPWQPAPLLLAVGAVLTTALVGVIGVVASVGVLRKKPLGTLRAE